MKIFSQISINSDSKPRLKKGVGNPAPHLLKESFFTTHFSTYTFNHSSKLHHFGRQISRPILYCIGSPRG